MPKGFYGEDLSPLLPGSVVIEPEDRHRDELLLLLAFLAILLLLCVSQGSPS